MYTFLIHKRVRDDYDYVIEGLLTFPSDSGQDFLTSLTIRKIPVRSTMSYHLRPFRVAINKTTRNKCWQENGE